MTRLPLLTLYNYAPGIFDGLQLPVDLNRDTVINAILNDGGTLTPIITDPVYLKDKIAAWAAHRLPVWEKLLETTRYEYDPISNYDRHEEWTDDTTGSASSDTTQTGQVQGFDSDSFADRNRATTDSSQNATGQTLHKGYIRGNIGVTTTQDMIKAQRDCVNFDLPAIISAEFSDRFLIQIY